MDRDCSFTAMFKCPKCNNEGQKLISELKEFKYCGYCGEDIFPELDEFRKRLKEEHRRKELDGSTEITPIEYAIVVPFKCPDCEKESIKIMYGFRNGFYRFCCHCGKEIDRSSAIAEALRKGEEMLERRREEGKAQRRKEKARRRSLRRAEGRETNEPKSEGNQRPSGGRAVGKDHGRDAIQITTEGAIRLSPADHWS